MKIAVFFVGELHDSGFNSSALAGAEAAAKFEQADISIVSGIRYDQDEIRNNLTDTATKVDGIVFVGGQGDLSVPEIARSCPDKQFAIIQGKNLGSNLSSYVVLQEISAFLAGCLAALSTKTGKVAHLSGHRVTPGLKGRAAFVGGVKHVGKDVEVLTGFCGTQDDNRITRAWTDGQLKQGADIIFTMLNGARQGAIDACRNQGAKQIGNALDWCHVDPELFIGSAIARIDLAVMEAIDNMLQHKTPGHVVEFGLQNQRTMPTLVHAHSAYVSLSLSPNVPQPVRRYLLRTTDLLKDGSIGVPADYAGPEFTLETEPCK